MLEELEPIIQTLKSDLEEVKQHFRQQWENACAAEQRRVSELEMLKKEEQTAASKRAATLKSMLENCNGFLTSARSEKEILGRDVSKWLNDERINSFNDLLSQDGVQSEKRVVGPTSDSMQGWDHKLWDVFIGSEKDRVERIKDQDRELGEPHPLILDKDLEELLEVGWPLIQTLRELEVDLGEYRATERIMSVIKAIEPPRKRGKRWFAADLLHSSGRKSKAEDGTAISYRSTNRIISRYVDAPAKDSSSVLIARAKLLRQLSDQRLRKDRESSSSDIEPENVDWFLIPANGENKRESDIFNAVANFVCDPFNFADKAPGDGSPRQLARDILTKKSHAFDRAIAPIEIKADGIIQGINGGLQRLAHIRDSRTAERPETSSAEAELDVAISRSGAKAQSIVDQLTPAPDENEESLRRRKRKELEPFASACAEVESECRSSLTATAEEEGARFKGVREKVASLAAEIKTLLENELKRVDKTVRDLKSKLQEARKEALAINALQILGLLPIVVIELVLDHWKHGRQPNPLAKFLADLRKERRIAFERLASPQVRKVARESVIIGAAIRAIPLTENGQGEGPRAMSTLYLAANWLDLVVREGRGERDKQGKGQDATNITAIEEVQEHAFSRLRPAHAGRREEA